jgi:hypothetical protein
MREVATVVIAPSVMLPMGSMVPVVLAEVAMLKVMAVRVAMPSGRLGHTCQPCWRRQDPQHHDKSERVTLHVLPRSGPLL